jgi:hypothetical protein
MLIVNEPLISGRFPGEGGSWYGTSEPFGMVLLPPIDWLLAPSPETLADLTQWISAPRFGRKMPCPTGRDPIHASRVASCVVSIGLACLVAGHEAAADPVAGGDRTGSGAGTTVGETRSPEPGGDPDAGANNKSPVDPGGTIFSWDLAVPTEVTNRPEGRPAESPVFWKPDGRWVKSLGNGAAVLGFTGWDGGYNPSDDRLSRDEFNLVTAWQFATAVASFSLGACALLRCRRPCLVGIEAAYLLIRKRGEHAGVHGMRAPVNPPKRAIQHAATG